MEELLRLLEQKQEWLKKFLHLTQGYHAQLRDNEPAALEDIDYFLNNRQSLLNILQSTEKKITNHLKLNKIDATVLAQETARIEGFGIEESKVGLEVRSLDGSILRTLTRARSESENELKQVTRGKKAISGYRAEKSATNRVDVQR